jgi:hypothetical protein
VQLTRWYLRTIATDSAATTTTPNPRIAEHGHGHGSTATGTPQESKREEKEKDTTETARQFLADALALCDSFPAGADYRAEVEETMRLFEGPRYETVTPEEIAAIKSAMVSGRGGIATHSGHWYTCRNGHPVSQQPLVIRCVGRAESSTANRVVCVVCYRRVRHANAAGEVSRVWGGYRRTEPYACGRDRERYADGAGLRLWSALKKGSSAILGPRFGCSFDATREISISEIISVGYQGIQKRL